MDEKTLDIRIIRLPKMDMIKSPTGNPEEQSGALQDFHAWATKTLFIADSLPYSGGLPLFGWNAGQGFQFIIKKPDGYINDKNWDEFTFQGGLYAVFSAWLEEMLPKYEQLKKWLDDSELYAYDETAEAEGRHGMSYIVTPKEIMELVKFETT